MAKALPHMRVLKAKLVMEGYDQKALAAALGRSQTYVTRRMTGLEDYTTGDIVKIVDFLDIQDEKEFFNIFYPGLKFKSERRGQVG